MAEQHILNLIARLKDEGLSKGLVELEKNVTKLHESVKEAAKGNKELETTTRKLTESEKELSRQKNILEGQTKRLNNEIKKYENIVLRSAQSVDKKAKATENLQKAELELAKTEKQLAKTTRDYDREVKRATPALEKFSSTVDRVRQRVKENRVELARDGTAWQRFAHNTDEASSASKRLERQLGRLGRSMLGLIIASVIIFAQSFLSVITTLGAEVVALGSSLTFAAGVLGGTFTAALAQAIPLVGILAASMQRLSIISDALNQRQLMQKQSGQEAASAMDTQAQSAKAVADAQEALTDAQNDLNDARKAGKEEIEDLMAAEKAAQLQMERTIISQRDAKFALQDTIQAGDVGGIASAQLDVREAALDRQNSRTDLNRASQAANQARRGGVEGLDSVKDATERLSDATEGLAEAHEQAAQGAADQSAAESSLQYFLEQLSPAEKELYKTIARIQDNIKELTTPITDTIIDSITLGISRFEDVITDPKILRGFKNLSDQISQVMDASTAVLSNDRSRTFWEFIIGESEKNLRPLQRILTDVFRIFRNISEGAAPAFHELLKKISGTLDDWVDDTSNIKELEEFFALGLEHLTGWWHVLEGIVDLWGALMGVSSDSALETLDEFAGTLHDAADSLRENREEAEQFFNDTGEAFSYLGEIIVTLGKALVEAFDPDSVRALRDIFDQVLIPAIVMAIETVGGLAKVFADTLDEEFLGISVADILKYAVAFKIIAGSVSLISGLFLGILGPIRLIAGYFGDFVAALGELGGAGAGSSLRTMGLQFLKFAGIIGAVITVVILFKDEIIAAIGDAAEEVGPALSEFIGAFVSLANRISDLMGKGGKLAGVWNFLGDKIRETIEFISEQFSGFIQILTGVVKIIDGIISGDFGKIWDGLLDIVKGGFRAVLSFLDIMTQPFEDAAKGLFNVFVGVFEGLGGVLGDIFSFAFDKILGSVSTLIDGVVGAMQAIPDMVSPPGFQTLADELDGVGNDIDSFRETMRDSGSEAEEVTPKYNQAGKALDGWAGSANKANKEGKNLNDTTKKGTKHQDEFGKETKKAAKEEDEQADASNRLRRQFGNLIDSIFGTGKQSENLGETLRDVTNGILKEFGVDELKFEIPSPTKLVKTAIGGASSLLSGLSGGQTGGYFGDPSQRGQDDRIIKVAGGEAILTGWQQQYANTAFAMANQAGGLPYGSLDDLFAHDARPHATAPKFNRGGIVPGFARGGNTGNLAIPQNIPDAMGAKSGLDLLAWILKEQFGLTVVSGLRPGAYTTSGNPSDHGWGGAIDVSNGITTPQMDAAHAWLAATIGGGIAPSPGVIAGGGIKQMLYRTMTGGDHFNHIHVALLESIADNPSAVWRLTQGGAIPRGLQRALAEAGGISGQAAAPLPKVPEIKVGGPDGPLKDMLQGQANKMRDAANKHLGKQGSVTGASSSGVGGPLKGGAVSGVRLPSALARYNRLYEAIPPGNWGGYAMPFDHVAALAEWAGGGSIPGVTMAQVSKGEGILRPGSTGDDNGDGQADGYGLWAITRPYAPPSMLAKAGGQYEGFLNPVLNAMTMAEMYKAAGGLTPWYGTGHVTANNLHYTGALLGRQKGGMIPHFDQGGVVPGGNGVPKLVMAHGGETILPTHKFQGGGKVPDRIPTSVPKLVNYNWNILAEALDELAMMQDVSDFGPFIKSLTDLLREGGLIDDFAESIAALTEFMANEVTEWTYRIRRGIIGQIRTNRELSERTFDDLEEIADLYEDQMLALKALMINAKQRIKEINKQLKDTEKKAEREALQEERDEIRTAANDLRIRIQELNTQIAENIAARYEAQNAIFDSLIARFDQRLTKNDLLRQIQEARNSLATPAGEEVDNSNTVGFFNSRGGILRQEQKAIERELRQARRSKDVERQRELRQALLENKLAQLENTQAIKDLNETVDTTNEIFSFNSTAWQLYRTAILNGMGGVLPQYSIPSLATGGMVTSGGLFNLHAGEAVTPASQVGASDININITEPMEVADPVALGNSIAWNLKGVKV